MDSRQIKHIIYLAIAVIGFVMIVGVGYLWYTQSSRNFKTYKSTQQGFEVKYPARWTVKKNFQGAAALFYSPKENDLDLYRESVNIVVQDLSQSPMFLNKYTEMAIQQMQMVFGTNMHIMASEEVFFAGSPGHMLEFIGYGGETDLHYRIYWTLKGTFAYQFTYMAAKDNFNSYEEVVERMRRSFKIL